MYEFHKSKTNRFNKQYSSYILFDNFSFILEHLSSDSHKELYKKLVVKSMIKVNRILIFTYLFIRTICCSIE